MYTTAGVSSRRLVKTVIQQVRRQVKTAGVPFLTRPPPSCQDNSFPEWGTLRIGELRTTLEAVFTSLLGKSCNVGLRDRSTANPVSSDLRLGFFHQRDEQIGGEGQVDLWPDFFVVGGNLDVGGGRACRVVRMRVVDYLQVEPFVSNIFLRKRKVLHVHYESNLGPLGW